MHLELTYFYSSDKRTHSIVSNCGNEKKFFEKTLIIKLNTAILRFISDKSI